MPKLSKKALDEKPSFIIPAGKTLLGVKSFERKTGSESGNDYIRFSVEAIAPKASAKKRGTISISCDVSKAGTAYRWATMIVACGNSEGVINGFETGSVAEGTDKIGDSMIRRHILGRVFFAELTVVERNGYSNNEVKGYFPRADVPKSALGAIEQWESKNLPELEHEPGDDDEGMASGYYEDIHEDIWD